MQNTIGFPDVAALRGADGPFRFPGYRVGVLRIAGMKPENEDGAGLYITVMPEHETRTVDDAIRGAVLDYLRDQNVAAFTTAIPETGYHPDGLKIVDHYVDDDGFAIAPDGLDWLAVFEDVPTQYFARHSLWFIAIQDWTPVAYREKLAPVRPSEQEDEA